jgi:hypothetical protein
VLEPWNKAEKFLILSSSASPNDCAPPIPPCVSILTLAKHARSVRLGDLQTLVETS